MSKKNRNRSRGNSGYRKGMDEEDMLWEDGIPNDYDEREAEEYEARERERMEAEEAEEELRKAREAGLLPPDYDEPSVYEDEPLPNPMTEKMNAAINEQNQEEHAESVDSYDVENVDSYDIEGVRIIHSPDNRSIEKFGYYIPQIVFLDQDGQPETYISKSTGEEMVKGFPRANLISADWDKEPEEGDLDLFETMFSAGDNIILKYFENKGCEDFYNKRYFDADNLCKEFLASGQTEMDVPAYDGKIVFHLSRETDYDGNPCMGIKRQGIDAGSFLVEHDLDSVNKLAIAMNLYRDFEKNFYELIRSLSKEKEEPAQEQPNPENSAKEGNRNEQPGDAGETAAPANETEEHDGDHSYKEEEKTSEEIVYDAKKNIADGPVKKVKVPITIYTEIEQKAEDKNHEIDDDGMPSVIVRINGKVVDKAEFVKFVEEHRDEFVESYNNVFLVELERLGIDREKYLGGRKKPLEAIKRVACPGYKAAGKAPEKNPENRQKSDGNRFRTGDKEVDDSNFQKGKNIYKEIKKEYGNKNWTSVSFNAHTPDGEEHIVQLTRQPSKDGTLSQMFTAYIDDLHDEKFQEIYRLAAQSEDFEKNLREAIISDLEGPVNEQEKTKAPEPVESKAQEEEKVPTPENDEPVKKDFSSKMIESGKKILAKGDKAVETVKKTAGKAAKGVADKVTGDKNKKKPKKSMDIDR